MKLTDIFNGPRVRLISLSGWKEFQGQLNNDEVLVIEYDPDDADAVDTIFWPILCEDDFERIYSLNGSDIYAFWAWNTKAFIRFYQARKDRRMNYNFRGKLNIYSDDWVSRRPVEDIVLLSMALQIPLSSLIDG